MKLDSNMNIEATLLVNFSTYLKGAINLRCNYTPKEHIFVRRGIIHVDSLSRRARKLYESRQ